MLASPRAEARTQHFITIKYDIDPTLPACPSMAEFRAILAHQLGYDPYQPGSPSGIWVSVRPTEKGIAGTVDWQNPAEEHVGERRFTSRRDECQRLLATIGFVVAVQIQLMDVEDKPQEPRDVDSTHGGGLSNGAALAGQQIRTAPSLTLTLKHFDVRRTASSDAANRAIAIGAGPAVGIGLARAPIVLGRLFGAVRLGWFGLEAGVEYTYPSATTEPYGGGFRHALTLGTLAACSWFGPAGACGLTKVGRLKVDGFGVDHPASADGLVAQFGPRAAYALELGNHFVLVGRAEALYLLTPWTIDLNHVAIWSMPRVGAVAGIDLVATFP